MPPTSAKKECNIQVAVRCRPMNQKEEDELAHTIVDCNSSSKKVTISGMKYDTKTFSFDHVFDPTASQLDVYNTVVSPLLEEVLTGFNCTVFAYGQTGTGKTHTMEGYRTDEFGSYLSDPGVGIIPRALHQLFEKLQTTGNEFTVHVSFLEIYNEEMFDLLSTSSGDPQKLRMFEDSNCKGSVIIQNLEEMNVESHDQVYQLMQKGAEKRRTSATQMNKSSSRSHSIFIVTVHQKENSITGEELLKTGKLYLVDLAGSENIGRSGAKKARAREAGNINQSLLTLGRVIQKLVQKEGHIPYRESKLTRLLQDSLGGKTKTTIIATVSPAATNLEETLSTLDYAFHAKNIKNRPEVNQKLTKKQLLKDYTGEIERLKRDLLATREKNGIYVSEDNYNEMEEKIQIQTEKIKAMEQQIMIQMDLFDKTKEDLDCTKNQLDATASTLKKAQKELMETVEDLNEKRLQRDRTKFLLNERVKTESELSQQAQNLLKVADVTTAHIEGLHSKLQRKEEIEKHNQQTSIKIKNTASASIEGILQNTTSFAEEQQTQLQVLQRTFTGFMTNTKATLQQTQKLVENMNELVKENMCTSMCDQTDELAVKMSDGTNSFHTVASSAISLSAQFVTQETTTLEEKLNEIHSTAEEQMIFLAQFHETFTQALSDATNKTLQFVAHQKDSLSAYQEQVKTEMTNASSALQTQKSNFKELYSTQEEKFKKEVSQAKVAMMSMFEKLESTTLSSLHEATSTREEQCEAFVQQTDSQKTVLHNAMDAQLESLTQFSQEVTSEAHQTVDMFSQGINATGCAVENLGQNVDSTMTHAIYMNEKMMETTEKHKVAFTSLRDTTIDTIVRASSATKENVQELAQEIEEIHSAGKKELMAMANAMKSTHTSVTQQQSAVASTLSQFTAQHQNSLSEVGLSLAQLVDKDMRKDISTGKTPAKMVYRYPRALATTRPHLDLLEEFDEDEFDFDTTLLTASNADALDNGCDGNVSSQSTGTINVMVEEEDADDEYEYDTAHCCNNDYEQPQPPQLQSKLQQLSTRYALKQRND
eukprot:m.53636 g.53636  ORF g.53636 m.53636 type:complete len:1047 (-) comp7675_c0_seq1:38-3178(-)